MEVIVLTDKSKFKIDNAKEIAARADDAIFISAGKDGMTLALTGTDKQTKMYSFDWRTLLHRLFIRFNLEDAWNKSSELERIRFLESIKSAVAQGPTTSGPCYLVYPRVP